jgi:hypothetical protein
MSELHSKHDDQLESRDRGIFARVVLLAGIALLVLFLAALLLVRRAGRHIDPVNPDRHPTSQVVLPVDRWLA